MEGRRNLKKNLTDEMIDKRRRERMQGKVKTKREEGRQRK